MKHNSNTAAFVLIFAVFALVVAVNLLTAITTTDTDVEALLDAGYHYVDGVLCDPDGESSRPECTTTDSLLDAGYYYREGVLCDPDGESSRTECTTTDVEALLDAGFYRSVTDSGRDDRFRQFAGERPEEYGGEEEREE